MEVLFSLLDHFVGDDTDPIDLLPLVVLAFLLFAVRHLRELMLNIISEIGELRAHVGLYKEIKRLQCSRDQVELTGSEF